jgi:hypothetical protein
VLLSVVFVLAHPRDDLIGKSPASSTHAACPLALSLEGALPQHFALDSKSFRMNTCKSVSKQRTLTPFRMNTYEKHRGEGGAPSRSLVASLPPYPQTLSFHTHTKTTRGGG